MSVRFKGVVSHTTALDLFRVERPERLLNDHQLHITVSKRHLRRQQFGTDSPDIAMHQWKDLTAEHIVMLSAGLRVLSPEATWGLLAPGLRIDELTEVAESLIRHGHATKASLEEFLTSQRFPGKAKCVHRSHWSSPEVIRQRRPSCGYACIHTDWSDSK